MNCIHSWVGRVRAVAVAGCLHAVSAASAQAHAFIDHTEPAVGSTVKQVPPEVRLSFSESLEAAFSSLKVFDAAGKEIDKKDVHANPKNPRQLSVSLAVSSGAGTYKVVWRAVSVDTHVTQGDFTFRVEP